MADTGIFATTAEVGYKAGSGASATSKAEAYVNSYMTQVEAFINSSCRYNFSDNYASLNADTKGVLKQIASDLAAIYVITYDMSGYDSRIDAEDAINVLRDAALRGIALLKDKKVTDFIREVA
jgi:glutaredoxin 2